jgi:tetratricopeptide (TPR) repeat protein
LRLIGMSTAVSRGLLLAVPVLFAPLLSASGDPFEQAQRLYQQTDYKASLQALDVVLNQDRSLNAAAHELAGKDHFMLGAYKKATEDFEKALALDPANSDYELWLGRAHGRRAETGGWLSAPSQASQARQCFETAVALNPANHEAMNDLFEYYLNAPAFLGGGVDKAEAIALRIAQERPAESQFELAQLAERRKQYDAAESHLRRAVELAPREVGRVLDLARFLAKRGRLTESDAHFEEAEKIAPHDPRVAFAVAKTNIENRRNLDHARRLLRQYLAADITPDDPPKQAAEQLLHQAPE